MIRKLVPVVLALRTCLLSAQAAGTAPLPEGLWGAEVEFGPRLRGPVRIEPGAGGSWTAHLGGSSARGEPRGDRFRFVFPDGEGELDVEAPRMGRALHGFWIQPRNNLGWFASPVPFRILWSPGPVLLGEVQPVIDRLSLYLDIAPGEDGGLRGVFHNPEAGWTGQRRFFNVRVVGGDLELLDPGTGKVRFQQRYSETNRTITMDFGSEFDLTPMTPESARRFLPRKVPDSTYQVPTAGDDGWRTARASSVGLDEARLASVVSRIGATDVRAGEGPRIHSLLVARKGKLVVEEYFHGFSADEPHDIRSAGKSFTSLMAGIAIDRKLFTTETPVYGLLGPPPDADARRSRITIGNLLTHSSGLACNDEDESSPGQEDRMYQQQGQPDWYRYALDLPMAHDPGTRYAYCTAGINLVGAAIAKTTGQPLLEFFDEKVATPLQMRAWSMNLMPSGDAYSGGGAYLRPRDLLKLGQVYVDGGRWNGRRIVSGDWVDRSTSRLIDVADGSADGYAWHLHTLDAAGKSWREFDASGNGGQLVVVIPELDLVVGFTAGNYNRYPIWRRFRDEIVPEIIASASR